ncbi:MAG TPA: zinc ribbon domain-containing protein [Planctomycetota bacterium]|jgi:hypothetical protein
MATNMQCRCGVILDVTNAPVGTAVSCHQCGQPVIVVMPEQTGGAAPKSVACPACAEQIPADLKICPLCGESIKLALSGEEQTARLTQMLAELDAHLASPGTMVADQTLKGRWLSTKSIVLAVLYGVPVSLFVFGTLLSKNGDSGGFIAFTILWSLILGIPLLVSIVHDHQASHIQDANDPLTAFKRFYMALQTNRTAKAFVSLTPSARNTGAVETITFDNPKIPANTGNFSIDNLASFAAYWKSILSGPSLQSRSVRLKKTKLVHKSEDSAIVEAQIEFTNYPTLLVLTIFLGVLIAVILIVVLQKQETKTVRKLLIKRQGRWFFAEGELEGLMDRIPN